MNIADPQSAVPEPNIRWFHPTPDRLVIALLAPEGCLLLSQWFGLLPKGWPVLIAIATVAVVMLLMLLWFAVALLFGRRFQFSIRSLLVLVVVVAVPCSWMAVERERAKTQKEAVEAIQRSAGLVFYDYQIGAPGVVVRNSGPPGPAALRSLLGDDFFAVVIEASLGNGGIEQVGRLPHLRRLNISVPIKDADLVHVEGLSELRELDLGGLSITDAGLEHLRFLKQLQYLGIWGTKVTNAGLRHLKALSELRRLNLSDTRVTDAGLQYVMGLPQLQELDLTSTKVTGEGVAKLQQTLPNCKITR
jgi:hypothetical protein